ncbi:unnamed protein product, partial [Closterium sp. Naga37s-1]
MDDGLTNASRAFAAQNGVGAKGDHDDGDADDVIVTVDPLRVKRACGRWTSPAARTTCCTCHVTLFPLSPRFSPLPTTPTRPRESACWRFWRSWTVRARAQHRGRARGGGRGAGNGGTGGRRMGMLAGTRMNGRRGGKGREGEGGLERRWGKGSSAGGAGGKAVAEAHGEWAWQGVMSQLTSAQEELRVIVDLVNAVESGAEGLAVSGVSKPKQHAAEMSSELTARLAGKLTLTL